MQYPYGGEWDGLGVNAADIVQRIGSQLKRSAAELAQRPITVKVYEPTVPGIATPGLVPGLQRGVSPGVPRPIPDPTRDIRGGLVPTTARAPGSILTGRPGPSPFAGLSVPLMVAGGILALALVFRLTR